MRYVRRFLELFAIGEHRGGIENQSLELVMTGDRQAEIVSARGGVMLTLHAGVKRWLGYAKIENEYEINRQRRSNSLIAVEVSPRVPLQK